MTTERPFLVDVGMRDLPFPIRVFSRVIASALVEKGYLEQKEKRGKYSLGLKFLEFADAIQAGMDVREVALPSMKELAEKVNENVVLMVRDGMFAQVVESVEVDHMLTIGGKWSSRGPPHCSAGGKVLLAFSTEGERERVRETLELTPETSKTIIDWNLLERELEIVREDGVGVDDEETGVGIRGVSAPVFDASGSLVAVIDVVGAKLRMTDERMEEVKQAVKSSALAISRALGCRPAISMQVR